MAVACGTLAHNGVSRTGPAAGTNSWTAVNENTAHMQHLLAQESSERDTVRFALHRLRTTAEYCRQRFASLLVRPAGLGPGEQAAMVSRARELTKEIEAEISAVSESLSPANTQQMGTMLSISKGGNYEVLRQSLRETQRQCESLNREMVQQSESNESLVDTLGTVKDANKRLLEQIRAQTAELAQLTQHRVGDEERLEQIAWRHETDRENARQETHSHAMSIRDSGADRHSQVQRKLTDKMRVVESSGQAMLVDAARLQREVDDRRREFVETSRAVEVRMQTWEQDLLTQMLKPLQKYSQQKTDAEKLIGNLRAQLLAERQERHEDNLECGRRHASLHTDKEDLQARITRECSQLSLQLQSLETRQLEERQSWTEEKSRLERNCGNQQQLLGQRNTMLEQLNRDLVVGETSSSSTTYERNGLEQLATELRRQARESDDALAAAVSSNEHLRDQMEEQRLRFQDKNSADLGDCRALQEQRIQEQLSLEELERGLGLHHMHAMEEEVKCSDQELARLQSDEMAAGQDVSALEADVALWKSKWDAVNSSRENLEKDFNNARRQFHSDVLTLQTMCERLGTNAEELEREMHEHTGELQVRRRWMVSKEAESATRQAALEGQLKESQELLESCRQRLREAAEHRARVNGDADIGRQKAIDALYLLERNLEGQVQALYSDRERYEAQLENERCANEQAKEECERERELVNSTLRHHRDENQQRLDGAERQRTKIEETSRNELTQGNEYLAHQQSHVEELERTVGRVRALLMESESNLAFIRQECLQEEREGARQQQHLQEEVLEVSAQLERVRRDESSLLRQAEVQRFRSDQERQDLRRGLDDLGHASATGSQVLSPTSGYSRHRALGTEPARPGSR